MKMQGRLTRLLCLALITVLLAGFLPGVARAAENITVTIDTGASVTLKDTDGDNYYEVGTADELQKRIDHIRQWAISRKG